MVAKSGVVLQRNLLLEQKHKENTDKIKELTKQRQEVAETFEGYQSQTKKDKEAADALQISLEQQIRSLENTLEETKASYEKQIRSIEEENTIRVKRLNDKIADYETDTNEVQMFKSQKKDMEEQLANLQERLEAEKNQRLEQVN